MTRQRVVAYVTRGERVLVFREDGDERRQAPAGRCDPGESLEETLHRELEEEVGIRVRLVREVGVSTRERGDGVVYESHYFHCETDDARDAWTHVITGNGDDAEILAHCAFVPIGEANLMSDHGEFLHKLV